MSAFWTVWKMKKALYDKQEKPSAEFCHNFEQQPEGKAMLKSKFCCEFKEMKENNFTIVQLMTAEAVHVDVWSWLWTISNKIFFWILLDRNAL